MLSHNPLSRSKFPLGDLDKKDVRNIAKNAGLPTADKKDSTGICFVGEQNFKQFLERYLPANPGNIISLDHKKVGTHSGLMYYTIGQRKGLGIGGGHSDLSDPWYVVGKDMEKNNLIVCQGKDNPSLYYEKIIATQLHWISKFKPDNGKELAAKIRYRQKDQFCNIEMLNNNSAIVSFQKPVFAAAPGQSIVFYYNEVCLGGGIIEPYVN